MTLPYLALSWLGGICIESVLGGTNTLAYYNGTGEGRLVGVVAKEAGVRDRCANLKVSARYLETKSTHDSAQAIDNLQNVGYNTNSVGRVGMHA